MNIYDVAKLSGVSIATVSRVVNGSDKVSAKTKEKVLAVMKESGYTPNVFARGLGLDSMKTIGIMCPDISDAFIAQAVAFLENRLHQYGYDCILSCSGYKVEEKKKHMTLLLSKRIDALILVGSTYAGHGNADNKLDYIYEAAKSTPVFLINGVIEGDNIYCCYGDDFHAVHDVTSALIRQGKKRILFLCDSYSYSARRKLAGYEAALSDAGYPVLNELKFYTKNRIHYVRDQLLEAENLEFDSVVATDDCLAIGALKYAKMKGLRIPEDISITGYNNSQLSVGCEPELTSVDNHLEKLCNDTIDNMLKLFAGEEDIPFRMEVPCKIKKRCTTTF